MVTFWARYVLLKEEQGNPRADILAAIETKYGAEFRQQVENEISTIEGA